MESAHGSLLELHFHHHQVFIVCHYLTDYALTGIFPLDVGGNLVGVVCKISTTLGEDIITVPKEILEPEMEMA